jgi:hypothetical protein
VVAVVVVLDVRAQAQHALTHVCHRLLHQPRRRRL